MVHFYTSWAAQCPQIDDVFEEMCKLQEYEDVKFGRIEAEDVSIVSEKSRIAVVPTVLLLRNSRILDRIDGVNNTKLTERIKYHLENKDILSDYVDKPKESLEDRLKKLISQAPCVLFMKGNPEQPRCGFSRTIVSILDGYKADYKTFDILQDNEVREGLKKYSNWPTYPQLYINGDLIGGLDIVKEMNEAGELKNMLPIKDSVEGR